MTVMPSVTIADIQDAIVKETYTVLPDGRTTICQLTLKNGYTVFGESACVCIENFDAEKGNKYSRERAVDKVWSLLGYDLQNKVTAIKRAGAPQGEILTLGSPVTYMGTKVIHAVAMTRGDYNIMRGWKLPEDECGDDNGYLVEYTDGGTPNVKGFAGYVSWSPQGVFEKAYAIGIRQEAETYLDRMKVEFAELTDKVEKLKAFLGTEPFSKLSLVAQNDLEQQYSAMSRYANILSRRIAAV